MHNHFKHLILTSAIHGSVAHGSSFRMLDNDLDSIEKPEPIYPLLRVNEPAKIIERLSPAPIKRPRVADGWLSRILPSPQAPSVLVTAPVATVFDKELTSSLANKFGISLEHMDYVIDIAKSFGGVFPSQLFSFPEFGGKLLEIKLVQMLDIVPRDVLTTYFESMAKIEAKLAQDQGFLASNKEKMLGSIDDALDTALDKRVMDMYPDEYLKFQSITAPGIKALVKVGSAVFDTARQMEYKFKTTIGLPLTLCNMSDYSSDIEEAKDLTELASLSLLDPRKVFHMMIKNKGVVQEATNWSSSEQLFFWNQSHLVAQKTTTSQVAAMETITFLLNGKDSGKKIQMWLDAGLDGLMIETDCNICTELEKAGRLILNGFIRILDWISRYVPAVHQDSLSSSFDHSVLEKVLRQMRNLSTVKEDFADSLAMITLSQLHNVDDTYDCTDSLEDSLAALFRAELSLQQADDLIRRGSEMNVYSDVIKGIAMRKNANVKLEVNELRTMAAFLIHSLSEEPAIRDKKISTLMNAAQELAIKARITMTQARTSGNNDLLYTGQQILRLSTQMTKDALILISLEDQMLPLANLIKNSAVTCPVHDALEMDEFQALKDILAGADVTAMMRRVQTYECMLKQSLVRLGAAGDIISETVDSFETLEVTQTKFTAMADLVVENADLVMMQNNFGVWFDTSLFPKQISDSAALIFSDPGYSQLLTSIKTLTSNENLNNSISCGEITSNDPFSIDQTVTDLIRAMPSIEAPLTAGDREVLVALVEVIFVKDEIPKWIE